MPIMAMSVQGMEVNLYKGRKMVRTAVPEEEAIGALREMIEGRS